MSDYSKIVYKTNVIGLSWDNKVDNFVAQMEARYPMDDKALIKELANNILIRDMILAIVFNVSDDDKFKLFKQFNEIIEDQDKEIKNS